MGTPADWPSPRPARPGGHRGRSATPDQTGLVEVGDDPAEHGRVDALDLGQLGEPQRALPGDAAERRELARGQAVRRGRAALIRRDSLPTTARSRAGVSASSVRARMHCGWHGSIYLLACWHATFPHTHGPLVGLATRMAMVGRATPMGHSCVTTWTHAWGPRPGGLPRARRAAAPGAADAADRRPGPAAQVTQTSNLFRSARRRAHRPRRRRLHRRPLVDTARPHRGRARHDDVRGPGRGDPPVRPDPAGRPAAQDDHARRRSHRARHRVGVVPQRLPARVRARDGRPDRRRPGASRATPDSEHSDLFYGFPNSYGTLGYALRLRIELEPVTPYIHLRHVRFTGRRRRAPQAISRVCADRGVGRRARSTSSTAPGSPPTSATSRWPATRAPRRTPRTTPASRSTTARSSNAARTGSRPTTTCGAGTPTGSGARGRSARRTRGSAGSGRRAGVGRTSTGS